MNNLPYHHLVTKSGMAKFCSDGSLITFYGMLSVKGDGLKVLDR